MCVAVYTSISNSNHFCGFVPSIFDFVNHLMGKYQSCDYKSLDLNLNSIQLYKYDCRSTRINLEIQYRKFQSRQFQTAKFSHWGLLPCKHIPPNIFFGGCATD